MLHRSGILLNSMRQYKPSSVGFLYTDSGGSGPVVVFLHGVLMNGSLWDSVIEGLKDRFRCIVPELPFGAHTTPMADDADLSLKSIVNLIAEFLEELDLRNVTLVCNDWGGAQLVVSPGQSDRVSRLVLVSCEAFDNYPPGVPGRLLCVCATVPGGLHTAVQMLRFSWFRNRPFIFGGMSKKRIPNDLFMSWIQPALYDPKVRRDLKKYLRRVPKKKLLVEWAAQQRSFRGPVLVIWAREDKLMPTSHATRLAKHFENSSLVWVNDSGTLIPMDQPKILTDHLHSFMAE